MSLLSSLLGTWNGSAGGGSGLQPGDAVTIWNNQESASATGTIQTLDSSDVAVMDTGFAIADPTNLMVLFDNSGNPEAGSPIDWYFNDPVSTLFGVKLNVDYAVLQSGSTYGPLVITGVGTMATFTVVNNVITAITFS